MLSEAILVSCGLPATTGKKSTNPTPALKDASIAIHSLPPQASVKQTFKKSAATANGVAASHEHVFVVQADKAIVNVYSRERGNQECLVPFQERITALTLACDGTVVVLGTESGRLMLWETPTGRLVSTSSTHLQAVTCLAVSGDSSFVVSGSPDSSLHTWSAISLLSFDAKPDGRSPIASMTSHRAGIMALAISSIAGPGAIAVSAASDGTAVVFDYVRGEMLRTFVLTDPPTALALDPADRGFYAGYQDGSVQLVDFFDDRSQAAADVTSVTHSLHSQDAKATLLQPPTSSRWRASAASTSTSASSGILSLALSWDGMTLVSGHVNGQVSAWNIGQRSWQSTIMTMAGPVTNVVALPLEGWADGLHKRKRHIRLDKVVKPKFEAQGQEQRGGQIPGNYIFTAQLTGDVEDGGYTSRSMQHARKESAFQRALTCDSGFPQDMLQDSLSEFALWKRQRNEMASTNVAGPGASGASATETGDFMSLTQNEGTGQGEMPRKPKTPQVPMLSLEEQNTLLRKQLAALQRVQRVTFRQLDDLREQRDVYLSRAKDTMTEKGQGTLMEVDDQASAQLTAEAAEFVEAEVDGSPEERRDGSPDLG